MGIFDLESREALIGKPTVDVGPNANGNVLERLEYLGTLDLESREALIGEPTVTVGPDADGNVLERLAYLGTLDLESREALIGTPTVSVTENPTGNVLERLAYLASIMGGTTTMRNVATSLGIPPPISEPVDRTISENMTFEDAVVHYYRNLTIAPGVTVTLRNGPMIFVVEGDLTIGEGAVVSGDGLGGKGGPPKYNAPGKGGYGGNFWNFAVQRESPDPSDPFLVAPNQALALAGTVDTTTIPTSSYPVEGLAALALFGPENTGLSGAGSVNGKAWSEPSIWASPGFELLFFRALVFAILSRATYDPTYGGLGGGGGGSGSGGYGSTSVSVPSAKYYAGKGHDGDGASEPGTGGLGFGGGGSGGTVAGNYSGIGGAGGNGGGTQLWIVKRINNAGIIRSNGTSGGNATGTRGGGGGGGGGGCAALLLYGEPLGAGVGTWQANGGPGGNGTGTSAHPGGNGGAGLVKTVRLVL